MQVLTVLIAIKFNADEVLVRTGARGQHLRTLPAFGGLGPAAFVVVGAETPVEALAGLHGKAGAALRIVLAIAFASVEDGDALCHFVVAADHGHIPFTLSELRAGALPGLHRTVNVTPKGLLLHFLAFLAPLVLPSWSSRNIV